MKQLRLSWHIEVFEDPRIFNFNNVLSPLVFRSPEEHDISLDEMEDTL